MIALDVNTTTREVFGNITPWMRVVFFVMIAASLGVLAWQVVAHVRQWRKGRPGGFERRLAGLAATAHRLCAGAEARAQKIARRPPSPATLQWLRRAHDRHHASRDRSRWSLLLPSRLVLSLIYELTMDVFGVAFCLGCLLAMYRRAFQRPAEPRPQLARLVAARQSPRPWSHRLCGRSAPPALHAGATVDGALVDRRLADRYHDLARDRRAAPPRRCTS